MRIQTLACGLVSLVMTASAAIDARASHPRTSSGTAHVRGTTPRMARILDDAVRRSPTVARLVTALDASDVIVHIEDTRDLPPGTDGCLMFTVAAGPVRYLRARILGGLGPFDMAATIGHELQHALEVAQHPDVRDSAAFVALYQRIGERGGRGHYDTAAARMTGRKVRSEMAE